MKSFYEVLPKNHFDNLYNKTINILSKGENVLVSALYGCGSNIFPNYFSKLVKEDNIFDNVILYDTYLTNSSLSKFVRKIKKTNTERILVIVKTFDKIQNKKEVLEEIHSLRKLDPFSIVFLILTDPTGLTNPQEYTAYSTPFFSGRFYIGPFNIDETTKIIDINNEYFGWNTDKSLYQEIYNISGGVARITKHICQEIAENNIDISNHEWFINQPSIYFQLESLIKIVLSNNKSNLKKLRILDDQGKIKSLLLEEYLKKYKSQFVKDIYLNLTPLEGKVLTYLYENKGRIVTTEEIGDFLEMNGHEFSLWAMYKLISRLKIKIKNNFELQNIKGEGYILKLKKDQSYI
jgi:hypothetical protein